jgi:transketolase
VTGLEPLVDKWQAFGWYTQRVDGNDLDALVKAFDNARGHKEPRPRMILCDTKMAKGVPFLEEREMTHFLRVDEGEWDRAMEVLDARRQDALSAGRQP